MRFEFTTAGRIVFGPGTLSEAGGIAASLGKRPLIVAGRTVERAKPLLALLAGAGLSAATFSVPGEPDVEIVEAGAAHARRGLCDCVVAFGGGAVIDAAKAIAVMARSPGELMDYLEVIGKNRPVVERSLPVVAIPTTAGTGSEVTRNSVIISREHRVKVSLRSPMMLPVAAIVDPELTYDLPPAVTAATGLDALAQLIEPFVCTKANPMTDGLCREGMVRVARSLRRAHADGHDAAAREDMTVASLFGGLALANAGLGAVHGLAGPLGGMIDAPHGAVCAALLPHVMAANLAALRARARAGAPQSPAPALARYDEVARLLTGRAKAAADEAVAWIAELTADLGIPGLGSYGFGEAGVGELVEKAMRASSMKANPVELTAAELDAVVRAAV
jgi:alcohol dehydrogenase class IV